MRIVLIGFMGSGKSTIARLLANKLSYEIFEMDRQIIESSELDSIVEIFARYGEKHFRDLETGAAKEAAARDNIVVSTGGGVIGNQSNMQCLKSGESLVVYLQASFSEIENRLPDLKENESRPLFENPTDAKKLHSERDPIYRQYADLVVETDKKSADSICSEILCFLDSLLAH